MQPEQAPVADTPMHGPWAPLLELVQLLELGGPVLVILALLSVLALTIILLKLWQMFRLRRANGGQVEAALRHWANGHSAAALNQLRDCRDPLARVAEVAIDGLHGGALSEQKVREETARVAALHLDNLRSQLRTLEVIAALSPLLGLLGTVIGMIDAFRELEAAGARVDPSALSGGIWEALLTTAAGLSVAIPCVAALNLFERSVERFARRLEDAVTRVFTTVPAHALSARSIRSVAGHAD